MSESFHISSLLLHARPDTIAEVTKAISNRDGAEVLVARKGGKIITLLKTKSADEVADCLSDFSLLDGVERAQVVYHETMTSIF